MTTAQTCPVCRNADGGGCQSFATGRVTLGLTCDVCGEFEITPTVLATASSPDRGSWSALQRAAMSHRIRSAAAAGDHLVITSDLLDHFLPTAKLPSPAIQATNLIRVIGDHVTQTGEAYFPDESIAARVGAFNQKAYYQLLKQLMDRGVVLGAGSDTRPNATGGTIAASTYDLSLDGWSQYEAERQGKIAGRYGFLAMKFNDEILDSFVAAFLKPIVKRDVGFDVVDLRDVSRAGVIDNILREQIRDAAFVIVDLTHDNAGAYWEAGYAEGLGKPVIYTCERAKFDAAKTHFDTNHCTTVLWEREEGEQFGRELVATLRRSLDLFLSR